MVFFLSCLLAFLLACLLAFFFFFCFFEPYLEHMEVPRLWVELQLKLPACTTATLMWDPSHVCSLHHSSRQRQILNPLSQAKLRIKPATSWFLVGFVNHWATTGTPLVVVLICISLIISDVEHFSCACWPSVHFPWKNVYSGLWPIFPLGDWLFCCWVV